MDTDRQPSGFEAPRPRRRANGLSYKFQRLRERLRSAVAAGEFSGKLPGERTLARRFHVNAKTLSKALTDLAAEGLLDRSIGRGTYVKGQGPTDQFKTSRWLTICEPDRVESTLVKLLKAASPEGTVVSDVENLRPSFLKGFDAVIDLGLSTPEAFLRDLVVRNVPVVAVNREPDLYSLNTVGADRALGASFLTRDLCLGGHARFVVVQSLPRSVVPRAVEQAAAQYGTQATVRTCGKDDLVDAIRASGATAVVCDSSEVAREVVPMLAAAGIRTPEDVSLVATGCCDDDHPCSGQYVDLRVLTDAITGLLHGNHNGHRPTLLWMATHWVDRGTSRPLARGAEGEAA